jgi:hypothetical protein
LLAVKFNCTAYNLGLGDVAASLAVSGDGAGRVRAAAGDLRAVLSKK